MSSTYQDSLNKTVIELEKLQSDKKRTVLESSIGIDSYALSNLENIANDIQVFKSHYADRTNAFPIIFWDDAIAIKDRIRIAGRYWQTNQEFDGLAIAIRDGGMVYNVFMPHFLIGNYELMAMQELNYYKEFIESNFEQILNGLKNGEYDYMPNYNGYNVNRLAN